MGIMGRAASQGIVFGDCVLNRISILSLFIKQGIFFEKCLKQGMALGEMS